MLGKPKRGGDLRLDLLAVLVDARQMALALGQVYRPAPGGLRAQRRGRRQHRGAVQAHGLQTDAFLLRRQGFARREHALCDFVRGQLPQHARILTQIENDDFTVAPVHIADRGHQRYATGARRVFAGHVQHCAPLAHIEQLRRAPPVPRSVDIVEQSGLARFQQACHRHRSAHVCEGVVGLAVLQPVGPGQILQAKARGAVFAQRPCNPVRAQRMRKAQRIDQVPARVAVLPLARVSVVEVAVQQEAGELVVEPDAVVADTAGAGRGQLVVHA